MAKRIAAALALAVGLGLTLAVGLGLGLVVGLDLAALEFEPPFDSSGPAGAQGAFGTAATAVVAVGGLELAIGVGVAAVGLFVSGATVLGFSWRMVAAAETRSATERGRLGDAISEVRGDVAGVRGEVGAVREDVANLRADVAAIGAKLDMLLAGRGLKA